MSNLQDIVVKEMKVKPSIESKKWNTTYYPIYKNYVQSHSFIKSLTLGISGGQDSTLAGKLCQLAVNELKEDGNDCEFIAVKLPLWWAKDAAEVEDALTYIQPDKIITVNIKPAVDQSIQSLKEAGVNLTDFQKAMKSKRTDESSIFYCF